MAPIFIHLSACGVHSISELKAGLMERALHTHRSAGGGGGGGDYTPQPEQTLQWAGEEEEEM